MSGLGPVGSRDPAHIRPPLHESGHWCATLCKTAAVAGAVLAVTISFITLPVLEAVVLSSLALLSVIFIFECFNSSRSEEVVRHSAPVPLRGGGPSRVRFARKVPLSSFRVGRPPVGFGDRDEHLVPGSDRVTAAPPLQPPPGSFRVDRHPVGFGDRDGNLVPEA